MWTVSNDLLDRKLSISQLNEMIASLKETHQIEMKEASQLPKSFWETCSSFANTSGGNIILGVREENDRNIIVGVKNPDKILMDIWNSMSNPNKINRQVISNEDVIKKDLEGKWVLFITVPEAQIHQKPVYLNGKLENTYLRTGDGDRKATNEQIAALLRNQVRNMDSQVAAGYVISDLDAGTVKRMKFLADERFPSQNFLQMSDEDFLIRIGAARKDRKTGEFILYTGTILLAGKTNIIQELFPHFHLDYYELDLRPSQRWKYRISDDDYLNGEINLITFYEKVLARLSATIEEGFSLNQQMRRNPDGGITLLALREALVNSLVHADYQIEDCSVRIECGNKSFIFSNPGQMLIPENEFFIGGTSVPRNELLMKVFRMLGFAERQGFGGSQIYDISLKREYRLPEITTSLQRTSLTVWTTSVINLDHELSENDKLVLSIFIENEPGTALSMSSLGTLVSLSSYQIRKSLNNLISKGYIEHSGAGRSSRYLLVQNRRTSS